MELTQSGDQFRGRKPVDGKENVSVKSPVQYLVRDVFLTSKPGADLDSSIYELNYFNVGRILCLQKEPVRSP